MERILGFLKLLGIHYRTIQHNNPDGQNPNCNKYAGQNHHKLNWVKNQDGHETSKLFCASIIGWAIAPFYVSSYYKIMATNPSCRICALYSVLSTIFHCLCAPSSPPSVQTCRWFIADYKVCTVKSTEDVVTHYQMGGTDHDIHILLHL